MIRFRKKTKKNATPAPPNDSLPLLLSIHSFIHSFTRTSWL